MIRVSIAIIAATCLAAIPARAIADAGAHQAYEITIVTTKGRVYAQKPLGKAHIRHVDASVATRLVPIPGNATAAFIGQGLEPGSYTALVNNEVAKPYVSSCKEGADNKIHLVMSIYHTGYTILLVAYKGKLKVTYDLSDAKALHAHDVGPCTVQSPNVNVIHGEETFPIRRGKTRQILIRNPEGQDKALLIRRL